MEFKRTFSEWLANRYQLIIRNEENLAETSTFVFTYARLLVALIVILSLFFSLGLVLSKTVLAKWFDPKYTQIQTAKHMNEITMKIDSLIIDSDRRSNFIHHLQYVLNNDTLLKTMSFSDTLRTENNLISIVGNMELTPLDSQFREEFKQSETSLLGFLGDEYSGLYDLVFFRPTIGVVSDHYDVKNNHHGIKINTKPGEPVKAVSEGTVILATWISGLEYVLVLQHSENLLSIYMNNAKIFKKKGNFVGAGDIISITDQNENHTGAPYLYFELWYNGNSLNPEEFMNF